LEDAAPVIHPETLRVLWAFTASATPHEACGVIAGRTHDELSYGLVVMLPNISPSPADYFEYDPRNFYPCVAQFDGWRRLAMWHSHPHGRAEPSKHDCRLMRQLACALPMLIVAYRPTPCVACYHLGPKGRQVEQVWWKEIPR
jgi:proteasome lid subunit RPN8/RPN11